MFAWTNNYIRSFTYKELKYATAVVQWDVNKDILHTVSQHQTLMLKSFRGNKQINITKYSMTSRRTTNYQIKAKNLCAEKSF